MALRTKLDELVANLKNNVPQTVLADDALLESNWNNMCASIKLLTDAVEAIRTENPDVPPAGFSYVRLPGMKTPWEQYPRTTKTQWTAIHELYPGDFLRLAGGNASSFQAASTAIQHESGVKGSGGGQIDSMQQHTHGYQDKQASTTVVGTVGIDNWQKHIMYNQTTKDCTSTAGNGREAEETRPVNVTVEWYVYNG